MMFRREQFELVNGYAVSYWGWGLEVHCHCPLLLAQISPAPVIVICYPLKCHLFTAIVIC